MLTDATVVGKKNRRKQKLGSLTQSAKIIRYVREGGIRHQKRNLDFKKVK